MQAGGHYLSLVNNTHAWHIFSATAIKGGCVMVWKAIMTVEAAGFFFSYLTFKFIATVNQGIHTEAKG